MTNGIIIESADFATRSVQFSRYVRACLPVHLSYVRVTVHCTCNAVGGGRARQYKPPSSSLIPHPPAVASNDNNNRRRGSVRRVSFVLL